MSGRAIKMLSNSSSSSKGSRVQQGPTGGLFGGSSNRSKGNCNQSFLTLFEKHKWKAILKRLKSRKAIQFVQTTGCYGISTLALALGHNAPMEIIEVILDLEPALADQKDVLGASPLHIGCLNGSPLASIKLLVERFPHLAPDRDSDLRTPLHHAVEYICRIDSGGDINHSTMLDVVKKLIEVAPETIHWNDKHGDSPLDLAHIVMIETDSSSFTDDESIFTRVDTLYQFLKKESIKVYLQKKKNWEAAGFDVSVMKTESTSKTHKSEETEVTASLGGDLSSGS